MRKLLLLALTGLLVRQAAGQFSVEDAGIFFLEPGALVSIDGLTLEPSAALTLTDVTITRSSDPVGSSIPHGQSIERVYNFSVPVSFTGTLGVGYAGTELNGLTETTLQVGTRSESDRLLARAVTGNVDPVAKRVAAVYSAPVQLGQVTALAGAVHVAPKVFLQGAYNAASGRHKDVNSSWMEVLGLHALDQPYNYPVAGDYNGSESATEFGPDFVFASTGSDTDILDWVLLELRDTEAGVPEGRRAAFILENGQVVDVDGKSPVAFVNVTPGAYWLTVRHRNHLSVRSAATLLLETNPVVYDFTTAQEAAYQNPAISSNAAMKVVGEGRFGLWGGNVNGNGIVNYGAIGSDRYALLTWPDIGPGHQLGLNNILTSQLTGVYANSDVNMNGTINYGSIGSDRYFILNNVLNNQLTVPVSQH